MTASLRYASLTVISLTGVLAVLAGFSGLGAVVILLGAIAVLPPFPPMVAGFAAVVLTPVPAALVYHTDLHGAWVLLLPLAATALAVLEWRAVAWSGAIMAAVCGLCSVMVA